MSDQSNLKDQIKSLEGDLKSAFSQKRYEDVRLLADKVKNLDSKNRIAIKLMEKIQKIEAEESKKLNAEKIKMLEKDMKSALKESRNESVRTVANEILSLDPENKAVKKTLAKLAKIEAKAQEKKQKELKPADHKESPKGNVFTKLFAGKPAEDLPAKPTSDIVETIVEKKEEPKVEEVKKEEVKKEDKERTGLLFLHLSRAAFHFTFLFLVISAGFFYVQNVDINNRVLSLVSDRQNVASQLYSSAGELESRKIQERNLNKEIREYRTGYNNQFEETIKNVVKNRIDWSDVIKKIDEVTESVYERNALAQYVVFDSYAFDVDTNEIRVSGTLSDPLGKNLTKLIELEKAFRFYPGNPEDPKDKTTPYFSDVKEIKTVSKSLDRRTNKYVSNFQISFSLKTEETES